MMKLIHKTTVIFIWAFILLPFINLYALRLADPMRENMTYIANTLNQTPYVLLWVISFTSYLCYTTIQIMKNLQYHNKISRFLLWISYSGMIGSILIPYHPEISATLAHLHINIAMFATLLYVSLYFHILYDRFYFYPTQITLLTSRYITIIGSCIFLFILMGSVTTLLEISFVISLSIYLYWAMKKTA